MTFARADMPEEARRPSGLYVTALNGTVNMIREGKDYVTKVTGAIGSDVKNDEMRSQEQGVMVELRDFAAAINGEKDVPDHGDVRGALWDVALIEALLTSEGKELNLKEMLA
jgi:hypothetical protein